MTKTITTSKSAFDGGQQSKLNITEQHPISHNIASKQYNKDTTFSSPYLSNSQTILARQINLQNRTVEDNEISIFDAQKYFNEGDEQYQNHIKKPSPVNITEQYEDIPRYSSVSSSVGTYSARNYPSRSFYATPTASSEASWNSQTGLLSNPPGTIKVSLHNLNPVVDEKRKANNPRWFFGRNCPCLGRKSIQVDDKTVASEARSPIHFRSITSPACKTDNIPKEKSPASKTTMLNPHRVSIEKDRIAADQPPLRISLTAGRNFSDEAGFSFPILKPSTASQTVTISKNHNQIAEEPPRDSLEVFHPSNNDTPVPNTTPKNMIDDDAASDGSSDLFELESFSTQTTYPMYNNNNSNSYRRESLDEAANFRNPRRLSVITSTANIYRRNSLEEPTTPSVAPTEGYEPSEASIDWSVTTAEGFDRASVTTYDEMMLTDRDDGGAGSGGRRNSGSRGNGLLGLSCRSEKAVLVGPGPRRVGPGQVTSTSIAVPQHVGNWAHNKPPLAGRPNPTRRG